MLLSPLNENHFRDAVRNEKSCPFVASPIIIAKCSLWVRSIRVFNVTGTTEPTAYATSRNLLIKLPRCRDPTKSSPFFCCCPSMVQFIHSSSLRKLTPPAPPPRAVKFELTLRHSLPSSSSLPRSVLRNL